MKEIDLFYWKLPLPHHLNSAEIQEATFLLLIFVISVARIETRDTSLISK
jgi:hypothetical protein